MNANHKSAGRARAWATFAVSLLILASVAVAQSYPSRGRLSSSASSTSSSVTGNLSATGRIISTMSEAGSVGTGHANFECPNNPASSSPCLAAFGNALELGGKYTSASSSTNADIYLGAMQPRTDGPIVQILNDFGGGAEAFQWEARWDGDTHQKGHLYIGENKSDGRILNNSGAMYFVSAGGAIVEWNKGAQDVTQWYTGAGGTQVASMSVAGRLTVASIGLTAAGAGTGVLMFSGAAPTGPVACTTPAITHGTVTSFQADVGTSCTGVSTFAFTVPATTNGTRCTGDNITASGTRILHQTGGWTGTTVTMTNTSNGLTAADFADGADLVINCVGR